ncbi:bifunctional phosphatase PAP2/diacylglycerol kinase family protein [Oerskovia flava]|uniref:bifunctional phosphatase PAP2/diacylglycerol kinase family protein n=1 Tax=Oerskovia flava TaxID=2986422 RepID=UPI002240D67D|nr:bifunctional phosphatase PAP2/diacylglycerol kinase family protein [Oerskovia sp. JB1-3-2]
MALPALGRADRAANAWTNRLALGTVADTALVRLSAAADRGVLWAGVAAGVALTGRRGRDAAFRGYGSLLAASALANLVGKTVFGGQRPALDPLPLWRRVGRPPTSPSFPSGHSASAAAFVTGVAIEWPTLGLALAPLAGGVVYSRLHTGSHWLSDVVSGAALGTGVALAGWALLPRGPGTVPDVPAGPLADVPALADGDGLFVVVNSAAGSGRLFGENPLTAIRTGLPRAQVHVLTDGDDLPALYGRAAERGARAFGISGGDGTVSTAAAAARAHDLPLAVFPGGTLNHFAKAADLTSMAATVAAVRSGAGVVIDVADLVVDEHGARTERTVLNTFSVGVYPELVTEREKHEHRLGKWPAAVWAAARVLPRARPVRLEVDGRTDDYLSLFAGINRYYPQSLAPVERLRLDDGVLDVRTATAQRRGSRVRTFLEVAAGDRGSRLARALPPVREHLVVRATTTPGFDLRVEGRREADRETHPEPGDEGRPQVVLAHDGETLVLDGDASGTAVRLTMQPRALRIYAPTDPTAG